MFPHQTTSAGVLQVPDCHGQPLCDPTPVCPACGGLECLCRPRFFAGQLLSEEDLNRLDHYIQAKNRIHNRYLHGWGVVCGLEVVCGVCDEQGRVLVKPGYALSPCGNDIIVCRNESVDICDLINRCRPPRDECHDLFAQPTPPQQPGGVIDPAGVPGQDICSGAEEWVLAICYTEKPSRGVAALRATVPEHVCGCGCGGSGTCGCGSHDGHQHGTKSECGCKDRGATKRKSPHTTSRTLPEQCEPTVTCEGYRFVVYKKPKRDPNRRDFGAAQKRLLCCMAPLFRDVGRGPGVVTSPQQGQAWVIEFRDTVKEFLLNEGLYDCEIADKLAKVVVPAVTNQPADTAMQALNQTAVSIADVAGLALQKCLCAALLPPCPEPSQNDCVPIATVTVKRGECRVVRICNIGARRFLVTWPNIGYWLSLFINRNPLTPVLEKLCCEFDPADWKAAGVNVFHGATGDVADQMPAKHSPLVALLWKAIREPARRVTAEHLLLGAIDARNGQGQPFVSQEELAYPGEFLLFTDVVAPLVRNLIPMLRTVDPATGQTPIDFAAGGGAAGVDLAGLANQVAELRTRLAAQQKKIDQQQKTINDLKKTP
jgi:hypothetical protein